MIVRQAGCVAIGGRALLIEGPPASGKSSLALGLIDRGATLIGDDGVVLERRSGRLFAGPHHATRGLIEVRNLGVLTMPAGDPAPLALVLRLEPDAPRFIDAPEEVELLGTIRPLIRLSWFDPLLPLKAELALHHYGRE